MNEPETPPAASSNGGIVRSPSYPVVDLEAAISLAGKLREYLPACKPMPVAVALTKMGYTAKSGGGFQRLAAMKKFGLIDDKGSKDQRAVWVTERARLILLDSDDSPNRKALVREAALKPTLHAEVYERWPHGLPSDDDMNRWLVMERKFNENSVDVVVSEIRSTFEYAVLDSIPEIEDTNNDGDSDLAIKIGSLVHWSPDGVNQWDEPKKIVDIRPHDGEYYAFVEGEQGAFPMSQAALATSTDVKPPIRMLTPNRRGTGEGTDAERNKRHGEDVYNLGDQELVISAPQSLTRDEYDEIAEYFDLYKKKLKRRINDGGE